MLTAEEIPEDLKTRGSSDRGRWKAPRRRLRRTLGAVSWLLGGTSTARLIHHPAAHKERDGDKRLLGQTYVNEIFRCAGAEKEIDDKDRILGLCT